MIPEDLIWDWFLQIASAIQYLHSKKILHRDVKTQNVFLTLNNQVNLTFIKIKLGDFGISKILENTLDFANTFLGTPYFLSPEICSGGSYNHKNDIWMLGCLIYELATLNKPFEGKNLPDLMKNIMHKKHDVISESYSDDLKQLIDDLLEKDHTKRFSIDDILDNENINKKKQFFLKRKNPSSNKEIKRTSSKISKYKNTKLFITTDDEESFNPIFCQNERSNNLKANYEKIIHHSPRETREIVNLIENLTFQNDNNLCDELKFTFSR